MATFRTSFFKPYMDALKASVPPVKEMQVRDILKLIVSTDEADATLLQQGELPVTPVAPVTRNIPRRLNTLNRLMLRVRTRDFGAAPGSDEAFSDWTNGGGSECGRAAGGSSSGRRMIEDINP